MSLFRCIECGQLISLRRTRCRSCERTQERLHNMATQRAAYRDPVYRSMGKPDANDRCALCGLPGPDTWDHAVCLIHGGANERSNLRPAHRSCNSGRNCDGFCDSERIITF